MASRAAKRLPAVAFRCGLLIFTIGCTETEEPLPDPPPPAHVSASGLVVRLNSAQVVRVDSNLVSGLLRAIENETSADYRVTFLNVAGQEFSPTDTAYRLGLEVLNSAFVSAARGDSTWKFHLSGIRPGQTSLRIQIVHNDHLDYRSPPIPLQVDAATSPPTGMVLRSGGIDFVTVNWLNVSGELSVVTGQETAYIDVYYLDSSGNRFQPSNPAYALSVNVTNPARVEFIHEDSRMWSFRLRGLSSGTTGAFFTMLRNGSVFYEAPEIRIVVGG